MNKKQFLEELNTKNSSTIKIVNELLEQDKQISVYNKNVFARIFKHKKRVAKKIISKNFEKILNRTNNEDLAKLITTLFKEDITTSIISEKFETIIKRFTKINHNGEESAFYAEQVFLKELKKIPGGLKLIEDNYKSIIENNEKRYLFKIAQILKGVSKEIDDVLEQQLEENNLEVAKSLLNTYKIEGIKNKGKLVEEYALTLSTMIKELLKSENSKWIEIEKINIGSYSDVYRIKDKILKIGDIRASYEIPNHTRILQPLVRINFINEKRNNEPFACVEIADRIETVAETEENLEKLYEVFADLRESGIIWTDAVFENVGILSKPNMPSLNGQEINVAPNAIGFSGEKKGRKLNKGDMVILDTDYLYKVDSPEIIWAYRGYSIMFEKRWQQEQQQKISKECMNNKKENQEETVKEVDSNER